MVPATAISSSIRSAAGFPGGNSWPLLCDALGNALSTWAVVPGNVTIQGATAGVIGAGTVFGTMQFTGDPSLVIGAMQGGGLSGTTVTSIGSAIGLGLLSSLNGAFQYQGVSVGVGQGTDVSLILGTNVATLTSTLQLAHSAICAGFGGGSGSATPTLYSALAAGIAAMLATGVTVPGTGIVTPAGPLGPALSVGTSLSLVI
jgi:hypothetical protein